MTKPNVKGARFILKRTSKSGVVPTIPTTNDHRKGWLETDIYKGELFLNITDNKLWFRNNNDELIQLLPLNENGKIDEKFFPSNYVGSLVYRGLWDASTGNEPESNLTKGDYWVVSNNGNTDLGGIKEWVIGDFVIFNGTDWDKVSNSSVDIHSNKVLYTNDKFTEFKTIEDSVDFLLNNYVEYTDGKNVFIENNKISIIDNPEFNNVNVYDLKTSNNLYVSGVTNLYGNLLIEKIKVNSGKIRFNTNSNYLLVDGKGIRFYQAGNIKLDISATDNTISYNKLSYNDNKTFTEDTDIVSKKYIDDKTKSTISDGTLVRTKDDDGSDEFYIKYPISSYLDSTINSGFVKLEIYQNNSWINILDIKETIVSYNLQLNPAKYRLVTSNSVAKLYVTGVFGVSEINENICENII